ncbi:unnamed protein product [Prorocentrum cordatum]|uniref:Tyr recombinase domain-containing protein n=1 Tax=Prorocentrum cordatum TaxID=2364126 RepID=A0ABN9Q303_9DINO|nr:unnamed protein product [Polarella glacialis]
MPLPFVEVAVRASREQADPVGRKQLRMTERAQHLTNVLVSMFSYWECGCPKAAAAYPDLRWSPARRVAAENLFQDVFEFCRAAGRDAHAARGLGRLQKLASELASLPGEAYERQQRPDTEPGWDMQAGQLSADTLARALEVQPDRVKLKTPGPGCDPADHLTGKQLAEYVSYMDRCLAPEAWPAPLPRRCHRISKDNELKLVKDLLERGMGTLVPACDVPRDKAGCPLASGWFAVEHSEKWDRLIQDRRPQNATEERLAWLQLPSGEQLKLLRLNSPSEHVRGTVYDLKTYFYQVKRPQGTESRNVVGRAWQGRQLGKLAPDPNQHYFVALTVWGMGDANSCDVCQETNVSILRKSGCMTPAESLNAQLTVPVGRTWEGNYLDDHLTVQVFSDSERGKGLRDTEIGERAKQAWEQAGLPRSVEKDVIEQPDFTAWGTEVRDGPGEVGSPLHKRRILASLTLDILESKKISKGMFRMLLANYVHPFSHRRELFGCFHRSFTWLESLTSERDLVTIPADIRDELFAAAALLALGVAHIRWPVDPEVSASDATEDSYGSCTAKVPSKISRALFRVGAHRGEHVRLDWNEIDQVLAPTRMCRPLSDINEAFASFDWKVQRGGRFSKHSHINLQEMRALKGEIRRRGFQNIQKVLNEVPEAPAFGGAAGLGSSGRPGRRAPKQFDDSKGVSRKVVGVTRGSDQIDDSNGITERRQGKEASRGRESAGTTFVCGVDSRVCAGAFGKGRSSSFKLNGILRTVMPYLLSCRCHVALVWIGTHFNPADAPSRFRPLPEPGPPPAWIEASRRAASAAAARAEARRAAGSPDAPAADQGKARAEAAPEGVSAEEAPCPVGAVAGSSAAEVCAPPPCSPLPWAVPGGRARRWQKREHFAGKGEVTRAWAAAGAWIEPPLDAYPPEGYRPERDLLLAVNARRELAQIRTHAVRVGVWATPCTTFGLLYQNCGPGTRTADRPQGDGTRPAERQGNSLGLTTAAGCTALGEEGGLWVVENPLPLRLMAREGVYLVECDMCQFGLAPPDEPEARHKKSTYLLGNFPELRRLGRRCQGKCKHVHLEGAVKIAGRWQKRAALASAYTPEFAQALAAALAAAEARLRGSPMQASLHGEAHAGRLVKAAEELTAYGRSHGWGRLDRWLPDASRGRVVKRLIEVIQYLFNEKRPIAEARCAVLAVQQRRPDLRGQLGGAWDSVRSWAFGEDSQTRTPIPREIQRTLRRWALAKALLLSRPPCLALLECSIFVRVAMDGLLRPGEGANLKGMHVRFNRRKSPDQAVLVIESPKNKAFLGKRQTVLLTRPSTVAWLQWWMHRVGPDDPVFPSGYSGLRQIHVGLVKQLGIPQFTLAGLRAGGATELFMRTRNIAWVKFHGRWASERSLAHYIQEANAAAALSDLEPSIAEVLCRIRAEFSCLDVGPPCIG